MKSTIRLTISLALMCALAQEPASKVSPVEVQEAAFEAMRGLKDVPISFKLSLSINAATYPMAGPLAADLKLTAITELQDLGWTHLDDGAPLESPRVPNQTNGFAVTIKLTISSHGDGTFWHCLISVWEWAGLQRFNTHTGASLTSQQLVVIYEKGMYGWNRDRFEDSIKVELRDALDALKQDYRAQRVKPSLFQLAEEAVAK